MLGLILSRPMSFGRMWVWWTRLHGLPPIRSDNIDSALVCSASTVFWNLQRSCLQVIYLYLYPISIHLMQIEAHIQSPFKCPVPRSKLRAAHLHGLLAIVTAAGSRRGGLWLVSDGRKRRDKTEQQSKEEQEPALPETRLNLGQAW